MTPSTDVSIARLSNGTYALSYGFGTAAVLLYDARGRLLKLHDRHGSGPGELTQPPHLFIAPDGDMRVISGNRLLRFGSELNHITTMKIDVAPRTRAEFFTSGHMAVEAPVRTDGDGYAVLHFLDAAGRLQTSLEGTRVLTLPLLLTRAPNGIWVAARNSSEVRRYSERGALLRSLQLDRAWFQPWTDVIEGEGVTRRPRPRNTAMVLRDENTLVMLSLVADANWTPPYESTRQPLSGINSVDGGKLSDTVIEVFDLRQGSVRAVAQSPHMLKLVEGATDELFSAAVQEDGSVTVTIWRLEVRPL